MHRIGQGGLCLCIAILLLLQPLLIESQRLAAQPQQRGYQAFKRGDALRITLWQPWRITDGKTQTIDLNGDYPIDSRGYIFIPLIGEVKVVGYSPVDLGEELKQKLSPYLQEPVVIVEPLIRITMLGAFRRPGTYLIEPEASLWQLVDKAGGPRDDSNLEKMYVERSGEVVKKGLLTGYERAYSLTELGIFSGDQVFVPARSSFTVRDALEIIRFLVSLANLYFLIEKF